MEKMEKGVGLTFTLIIVFGLSLMGCTYHTDLSSNPPDVGVNMDIPSVDYSNYNYKINYSVSGCDPYTRGNTSFRFDGNTLYIIDDVSYVCCANLTLTSEIKNDTLYITEVNEGEICKCICGYRVRIELTGNYPRHVVLRGVLYPKDNRSIPPETRLEITDLTPEDLCISLCKTRLREGWDLSSGPCLSNDYYPDTVCDVAHSPRQPVDNLPENQCTFYREGRAHHFVEVDPSCNYIRSH